MLQVLVLCGLALVLLYHVGLGHIGRRAPGLPPGPPTLPLLGNLHQLPARHLYRQFSKWAQEYGPVYSLILGTKVFIIISSDQAVKDLLDQRGGIYSSRPENYIGGDVFSGGLRVVLMQYGETWRTIRKIAHRIFNEAAARSYAPYQDLESKAMLLDFLNRPDKFYDHLRRYSSSLTAQMTYGFRVKNVNDPYISKLFWIFSRFSALAGSPVAALLDIYPVLRRLPDFVLPVCKEARKLYQIEHDILLKDWEDTKSKLDQGTAKICFTKDLIRIQQEDGIADDLCAYMSGSLLQAGFETTTYTLMGFVQAMVISPEVWRTAQEELDRVCGDRIPSLDDEPDLPYTHCIMKETLRWMPTAPLGVPHAVIRDDEYMGYQIPKGAAVWLNVWGINNNSKRHPDPRRFDPSRWANDEQTAIQSALNPDVSKRDHFTFGAGRRLCQGTHIAERSMYLSISRLLWAFDFGRARNAETGADIMPDMNDLTDGIFVHPVQFKANITPRDASKAQIVRRVWEEEAQQLLNENMEWRETPVGLVWNKQEQVSQGRN